MSSSKRRKLDAQAPPQPAVSAISALAARRRLAANPPAQEPDSSSGEEDTASARTNAFSVLQNVNRRNDSPGSKSPKRAAKGGANKNEHKASSQKLRNQRLRSSAEIGLTAPGDGVGTAQRVSYSSFTLSKSNCRTTPTGVIQLRFKECARFLVLGSYGIRVLSGEVTISGATLRPSDQIHWVHAPQCHAIPVLRTSELTSLELHDDSKSQDFRKLDRLSPFFKKIWNDPVSADEAPLGCAKTFRLICTSDDIPKKSIIQELSSLPEWNKKLASLVSSASVGRPLITLVCGPKSSGKSTFSRLFTNRLLTCEQTSQRSSRGMAILDLDPGQPEYTPPGTVSLVHVTQPNFGVPFTHPSFDDAAYKVMRCHALASITPASAPDHYLESVMDLFATYKRTLRNTHLLINTPGWILGTGLDLLAEIITNINPTEVVYMSEDGPTETVESLRGATKKTFTTLPSQPSELTTRTALHLRTMSSMSYFHLIPNDALDVASRLRWNPSPLSALPPWQVRYSGHQRGILGIFSYDYQAPPELLAESINGMILAAVDIEGPDAFRTLLDRKPSEAAAAGDRDIPKEELNDLVATTPEGLPYIPNPNGISLDPRYSRAIGLVLIRGIDTKSGSLQIITSIPSKRIQEIASQDRHLVLVHGKFDTPTWAYTEDLYERSGQEDEDIEKQPDIPNDDASDDEYREINSDDMDEVSSIQSPNNDAGYPWVEVLRGNEKRPTGSRVWRVRRDLGRNQGE